MGQCSSLEHWAAFADSASLCFVVITSVPSQYFSAKRGLANGLMFAGSGFGGAVMSFVIEGLIQKLDVA